ncbi:hypothetical protein DID88_007878 [Monilinia fructigena]|uniref:Uncharacterized protein n=1 Tax=Monilinia fructigena TaxID=38457 RepID=A0A395J4L8_9HELO|nr:hypothetical protein DID88_007878 [Monilinia fructigena]
MHSTPVNATGLRSTFREPIIASNDKQEQELPRMKNLEREQMSPDDPLQLEDMLESQIRSEAADAAGKSDGDQVVSFEKEQSYKGDTRPTTSTLNHPKNDISGERELLWHAHLHRRHDLSTQSINSESPVSLHQAPAAKVSHDKQNANRVPLPGTCSRSVFKPSAIALALPTKSLYNGSTESSRNSVSPSDRALSRVSGSDKQVLQGGRFDSSSSRSHYVEMQNAKYSVPTCLKQQRYSPRKSPVQTFRSVSGARPALQERSANMGPPVLPQKIKSSIPFPAPLGPQLTVNSLNLPPSSTQAFLESHLDEFFPSPTQEARELCEDPIIPQSSTDLKKNFANSKLHKKPGDANDSDLKDIEDDFGVMLSTQELKMFSQDWESANSPPLQGVEKKNDSNKKIGVIPEAIENFICCQDSFFSSQEFAGLEPESKANLPATKISHLPQTRASKVHLNHHLSPNSQIQLSQPLNTRTPRINPDTELTPKPRRSPWFKEKPEDKHTKKRFFTEKPEDLEAAASLESKKAWDEIKDATSSNRHNCDDDIEPEVDDLLEAALAESKEWDEVYKAVVPTPTPRKSGKKGGQWMDVKGKENQTPSQIMEKQTQASATKKETKFEHANSDSSTDYGDGDDSDWDRVFGWAMKDISTNINMKRKIRLMRMGMIAAQYMGSHMTGFGSNFGIGIDIQTTFMGIIL